jgi:hypothetical protein
VQHEFSENFRQAFNTFSDTFGVFGRGVLSLRAADFAILRLFSFFPSKPLVADTNEIQREFSCNVAIATQEFFSASKPTSQKTNLFKQRRAVTSRRRERRAVTSRRREGLRANQKGQAHEPSLLKC